jgi:CHAT domain-containing protein/Tfp pilus assembly protein PilF
MKATSRFPAIVLVILTAGDVAMGGERSPELDRGADPQQQGPAPESGQSSAALLEEASRLQKEADAHIDARQFKEATAKTERALELRRTHLGVNHPDVAYSLNRLGILAYYRGDYGRAEMLIGDALRMREATLGADHVAVAQSLNDLAAMFLVRGDYVRPEPLFQRALGIYEKQNEVERSRAETQLLIAEVFNNLALLYHRRADYERAEAQYLQALAIKERVRGPEDPTVADTAANLGAVYYSSAQYDKAVQVLNRALAIQEKHASPNHPSLATSSFNLAAVYFNQGDYTNAEALFQRALSIEEESLDPRHPRLAVRLVGLAETLRLKGEYGRAEELYKRALLIRQQALGEQHPQVADTLIAFALLRHATGENDTAVDLLARGAALREETLSLVLTTGSEEAKRLYLENLVDETDIAASIHLGSAALSRQAAELALTSILQRKGRSLDAMAEHVATLRSRLDDKDRELFTQLSDAQGRLAKLVLSGVATDEQRKSVGDIRSEIERLEQTVSLRSAEYRAAARKVTLPDVERALPRRTVLIEFVSYRPFFVRKPRGEAFGSLRYAAYVLSNSGIEASIDLGDASVIDETILRFRATLADPGAARVRETARAMYQLVMQPIARTLRNNAHLVISPDGALNLIPFAALVGEDDRYLVEHYTISYVTSGRDLVRLGEFVSDERRRGPPIIVANPSFDVRTIQSAAVQAPLPASRGLDARQLEQLADFEALPGTGEEAAALAKVLPTARVYTGSDATESVVKQLHAPLILHIATHGFFLGASSARTQEPAGAAALATQRSLARTREDALLSSGLALAGANQRSSGNGQDGILTALEVAGLDLWGTRMVVLSACETGVGDARSGEGVYGLRRALVLAGSESQVMSLWQVSDSATRDLMIAYYRGLRSGEGRAEALRRVQLTRIRQKAHPFYWASFIHSGDWRPAF